MRAGTTSSSAYAPFSSGSRFSQSVSSPRAHGAHVPHGAEFAATTRRPVATSMPQNSCPKGDGGSESSSGCPRRNAFRSVPSVSATSTCTSTSPGPAIADRERPRRAGRPAPWKRAALTGRTRPSAPRGAGRARAPRRSARAAARSAPARRAREQRRRLAHRVRRRRARADDGQLAPVDRRPRAARPRRRRRAPCRRAATASSAVVAAAARADDGRVDRPVRRAARAPRVGVDREHVVAAPLEHRPEEPADEAVADDEHAPARHALRAAQHARERLDHRRRARRRRESGSSTPSVARTRSAKPAGHDRRLGELLARRLVPGAAARARAARPVVDERDRGRAAVAHDDLVPEHGPGRRAAELLDVRAAEPAREHLESAARAPARPRGAACRPHLGRRPAPAYRRS